MNSYFYMSFLWIVLTLVLGCGRPKGYAYEGNSNRCSIQFKSDHMDTMAVIMVGALDPSIIVMETAAGGSRESAIQKAHASLDRTAAAVNKFGEKYKGVVCEYQLLPGTPVVTLDVDEIVRESTAKLDEARKELK